MNLLLKWGLACVLITSVVANSVAQRGFSIGPVPSWVDQIQFEDKVLDTTSTSGMYYLYYSIQNRVSSAESYNESIVKIINDSGLSDASSIVEQYDPLFQQLTFHSLFVIRNGRRTDHLSRKEFEILQRETDLSRKMYDGKLSVIANLKDVQVGDIVGYSYTRKGRNPVFKNHFAANMYFNYGAASAKIHFSIIAETSRKLYFKDHNHDYQRESKPVSGGTKYSWTVEDITPPILEDATPRWYDPYARVEVTDFSSWAEVSAWAEGLFKPVAKKSPALKAWIDSLKSIPNEEERILKSIRTVQDEIRYLSFSQGVSGYQPHDPSEVFANKYGDCKDKSFLLATVLNELGVTSTPVLVDTEIGKVLPEWSPAQARFDHCIVQFQYKDSTYWLDPTVTLQRGSLNDLTVPQYYHALVPVGNTGLVKIAPSKVVTMTDAKEVFSVQSVGTGAKLSVTTTYYGDDANSIRDYFKSNSQTEVKQNYVNFYTNDYPEIRMVGRVTHTDDEVNNIITAKEEYEIDTFWNYDSTTAIYSAKVYARSISANIRKPTTKRRTTPLAINYPLNVHQRIELMMPEAWKVSPYSNSLKAPGLTYRTESENGATLDEIVIDHYLTHPESSIDPQHVSEYVKVSDKIYDELTFTVTYNTNPTASPSSFDVEHLIVVGTIIIGLGFCGYRVYLYDPRSQQHLERHDRIDGWLFLPGIAITIAPFVRVYRLFASDWYTPNHWNILADRSASIYDPSYGVGILVEFILTVALVYLSILAAITFWQRRTSAPLLAIIFYVSSPIVSALSIFAYNFFGLGELNYFDTVRASLGLIVWVPYFALSERVKGTFTRRLAR